MFGDIQNYKSNETQTNLWDEVGKFLSGAVKSAYNLKEEWDFQNESRRILANPDLLTIVRRLGRTEERYKDEIKVFDAIISANIAVNPPAPNPFMQLPFQQRYYTPSYDDYLRMYYNDLSRLTDDIPCFAAIKIGKERGTDWILDKLGSTVKEWFYRMQNS